MADASDFIKLIKQTTLEAVRNTQPVSILFGIVTDDEDIKITIEQGYILEKKDLIIPEYLTNHSRKIYVDHVTEKPITSDAEAEEEKDIEDYIEDEEPKNIDLTYEPVPECGCLCGGCQSINTDHVHRYLGEKSYFIINRLRLNDKVILLRMQEGQRFLVVDRVVLDD